MYDAIVTEAGQLPSGVALSAVVDGCDAAAGLLPSQVLQACPATCEIA